jgi:hypothetical protein
LTHHSITINRIANKFPVTITIGIDATVSELTDTQDGTEQQPEKERWAVHVA